VNTKASAAAMPLVERLRRPGPKKILALEGGGILGLISIEILKRLEELLGAALGRGRDFALAEYFDFVAGTSTGAIIASCIALGMQMEDIGQLYVTSGRAAFHSAGWLKRWRYKYEHARLARTLQQVMGGDTTLGSPRLKTLLMLVMRNATTDSPWLVSNNPFAKYNQRLLEDGTPLPGCNLDLPLWQLVRASTAAPTYFQPEVIAVGAERFVFVDGALTPYNNPAFMAFLMATVDAYRVGWPSGEGQLLVVSIGTGKTARADVALDPRAMHVLYHAAAVPDALLYAAQTQQDMLCRVFGKCLVGEPLDSEVGDLIHSRGPVSPKLFTYLRYDAALSRQGLESLGLPDIDPLHVQAIDAVQYVDELRRVGQAIGARQVRQEHFSAFLEGASSSPYPPVLGGGGISSPLPPGEG
jgi:patatin-like phospholipase/acyl hydrolase